jgi:hypothetical protein
LGVAGPGRRRRCGRCGPSVWALDLPPCKAASESGHHGVDNRRIGNLKRPFAPTAPPRPSVPPPTFPPSPVPARHDHTPGRPKSSASARELLALNRRLAKAPLLKEQLARLWDYTYEGAAWRFLTALDARVALAAAAGLRQGGPAPPPASRRYPRLLSREGSLWSGRGDQREHPGHERPIDADRAMPPVLREGISPPETHGFTSACPPTPPARRTRPGA